MINRKLFDREAERTLINKFFNENDRYFILHGESGTGKSSIVAHTIYKYYSINQIIGISFKTTRNPEEISYETISLKNKLHKVYTEERKKNFSGLITGLMEKFSSISIGLSGPSFSFPLSLGSIKIDQDYVKQFDKLLYDNSYRLLYISNLELCTNQEDIDILELLFALAKKSELRIKILFEIGSLQNNEQTLFLKKLHSEKKSLHVHPFPESLTQEFYKFYHDENPPVHIFAKTKGNPFYIVHFSKDVKQFDLNELVKGKLQLLQSEYLNIVYTLHVIGGQCIFSRLAEYTQKNKHELTLYLEYLQLNEIVQRHDETISFVHSFFSIYLNHQKSSFLIQQKIDDLIALLNSKQQDLNDEEILLLITLMDEKSDDSLIDLCWKYIRDAYQKQSYAIVIELCKILLKYLKIDEDIRAYYPFILLAQTYILIGNAQSSVKHFSKQRVFNNPEHNYLLSAIRAQLLYQENKFYESIQIIENIVQYIQDYHVLAILFGLNTSNYIAIGQLNKARENYTSAVKFAQNLTDQEISFELLRLSPKIYGWSRGTELLQEFINSPKSLEYQYTRSKCLHNIGFAKIMETHGEMGYEELMKARSFFELYNMPEITYSITALSIYYLLKNKLDTALGELLDGLNFAHEQYDRFALSTNIGNFYLLKGQLEEALSFYKKALNALNDSIFPLHDPVLRHKANYNLSLIHLLLENYDKAAEHMAEAEIPSTATYLEKRKERNEFLKHKIEIQDPQIILINSEFDEKAWSVTQFNFSIAKLSFYDLNLRILSLKDIPIKL